MHHIHANIDRPTGVLSVDIPSYIPSNMIAAPGGTTHYKIISAGVDVDFENETYVVDSNASAILALGWQLQLLH
ncbi:MAG: hypothetical protein V9E96_02510 [Chitinophagaceae bacterium]